MSGADPLKKSFNTSRPSLESVLDRARSYIKAKNFKRAVEELERHKFHSVDYYLLLAEAYEALGDSEKAESYFEEARFLDTELRSKELLEKGITLALMKNYRAAEKELLESAKLNPFNGEVYKELYRLYRETSNHKKMVEALKNLMTVEPHSPFPYLELGRYYYVRRRYSKAVDVLKQGAEITGDAAVYFQLGKVFAEWGKTEEAVEALKQACMLDYKNLEYRHKLAEVLVNSEDYDRALEVILNTLNLYPDSPYVLQNAAALYDLIGNEELAEHYYRKAIACSEGFVAEESKKLLAEFFIEKGRYDQAEEILREIVETTENVWVLLDAFTELALIFVDQGRLSDLIEVGMKILESEELSEEEFCELAEVVADAFFEEKRYKEALELYSTILSTTTEQKVAARVKERIEEIKEITSLEEMI